MLLFLRIKTHGIFDMFKKSYLTAIILSASLFSLSSQANTEKESTLQSTGPYALVGAAYNKIDIDIDSPAWEDDDDAFGYRLGAGYQLHKYFSVEAYYLNMGEVSANMINGGANITLDIDGFALSAKAIYPITSYGSVFARVGAYKWDLDTSARVSNVYAAGSFDGTDPLFGAGFSFSENWNNFALDIEWTRYQFEQNGAKDDVDSLMATVSYKF